MNNLSEYDKPGIYCIQLNSGRTLKLEGAYSEKAEIKDSQIIINLTIPMLPDDLIELLSNEVMAISRYAVVQTTNNYRLFTVPKPIINGQLTLTKIDDDTMSCQIIGETENG